MWGGGGLVLQKVEAGARVPRTPTPCGPFSTVPGHSLLCWTWQRAPEDSQPVACLSLTGGSCFLSVFNPKSESLTVEFQTAPQGQWSRGP